jgi:hypothetical protein
VTAAAATFATSTFAQPETDCSVPRVAPLNPRQCSGR